MTGGGGPELADIIRGHGKDYLQTYAGRLPRGVEKIMELLSKCRTSALGGHLLRCADCGTEVPCYNSCRNRHCPKCLGSKIGEWLGRREQELLPVHYFHVVFTIPHELIPLVVSNRREFYTLFFRAASKTLLEVARSPKHFGVELGFFGILHTWSQSLLLHPHIHFVVPALGQATGGEWIKKKEFFLPVKVLSCIFRGKLLEFLRNSCEKGNFPAFSPGKFNAIINSSCKEQWVIYAKKPFAGPSAVLKYLSRYTHRIAISNKRILALKNGKVTFSYKDYSDDAKRKTLTIPAADFLHRFFLHLVPKNFYRIRYFGFLSNRKRNISLAGARQALQCSKLLPLPKPDLSHLLICPKCSSDNLLVVRKIPKIAEIIHPLQLLDSS